MGAYGSIAIVAYCIFARNTNFIQQSVDTHSSFGA